MRSVPPIDPGGPAPAPSGRSLIPCSGGADNPASAERHAYPGGDACAETLGRGLETLDETLQMAVDDVVPRRAHVVDSGHVRHVEGPSHVSPSSVVCLPRLAVAWAHAVS